MRYPTVLFDLDGTLVDSGHILLRSFRHATQTVLRREIPDSELLAMVGGHGLLAQMSAFDPDRAAELVRVYTEHNTPLYSELEAFPGIEDALGTLQARGHRLGVVTTKRRQSVALCASALPLDRYFDVIISSEDTPRHKPAPEPLVVGAERLGSTPAETAYVGDAPFDIQAAKAAGMFAVAVDWGGIHPRERLEAEEPDVVVERPEELLDVL